MRRMSVIAADFWPVISVTAPNAEGYAFCGKIEIAIAGLDAQLYSWQLFPKTLQSRNDP
jgi:hypothetical protein